MFGFSIGAIAKGIMEGVVGPLFGYLNKKEDVNLEKFKVNGQVDQVALQAHIEAMKARRDVLLEAMKYRGTRMVQYGFMVPLMIWWIAIIVFCIMRPIYPWWPEVKALPSNLEYVASGIVAFLFLTTKIDEWTRKT